MFCPEEGTEFHLLASTYTISIYARIVNRRKPILLSTVALAPSAAHAQRMRDKSHWAVLKREPESQDFSS